MDVIDGCWHRGAGQCALDGVVQWRCDAHPRQEWAVAISIIRSIYAKVWLLWSVEQLVFGGEQGRLCPAGDADLIVDVHDMRVHRSLGKE